MALYQKNGNWYIDYYVDHRRKREMIGQNRRMAEQVFAKRKVQILEGKYFDVARDEKIKFRDFANSDYEIHSKVNKKSGWCDDYRIKRLNTYFGDQYLNQITSLDIEKFKADRVKDAAPATVNRELALIKGIFTKAIQWEKFHRQNPAKLVKNFRENNERLRYLSKEEIVRL